MCTVACASGNSRTPLCVLFLPEVLLKQPLLLGKPVALSQQRSWQCKSGERSRIPLHEQGRTFAFFSLNSKVDLAQCVAMRFCAAFLFFPRFSYTLARSRSHTVYRKIHHMDGHAVRPIDSLLLLLWAMPTCCRCPCLNFCGWPKPCQE